MCSSTVQKHEGQISISNFNVPWTLTCFFLKASFSWSRSRKNVFDYYYIMLFYPLKSPAIKETKPQIEKIAALRVELRALRADLENFRHRFHGLHRFSFILIIPGPDRYSTAWSQHIYCRDQKWQYVLQGKSHQGGPVYSVKKRILAEKGIW